MNAPTDNHNVTEKPSKQPKQTPCIKIKKYLVLTKTRCYGRVAVNDFIAESLFIKIIVIIIMVLWGISVFNFTLRDCVYSPECNLLIYTGGYC